MNVVRGLDGLVSEKKSPTAVLATVILHGKQVAVIKFLR